MAKERLEELELGHEHLGGLGNGRSLMTSTILIAILAVAAAAGIGIAIAGRSAASKTRAKALDLETHPIDQRCASAGHAYVIHEAGWQCATCGNYVSRREGERYGLAKDGLQERRREPR